MSVKEGVSSGLDAVYLWPAHLPGDSPAVTRAAFSGDSGNRLGSNQ
jgi:hypothetical protein